MQTFILTSYDNKFNQNEMFLNVNKNSKVRNFI